MCRILACLLSSCSAVRRRQCTHSGNASFIWSAQRAAAVLHYVRFQSKSVRPATLPNWRLCQLQKEETDRLRSQTTGLIGAMDCFSEGIMLVNTDSENWNILFVNDAWSRVTGEPCRSMRHCLLSSIICWMHALHQSIPNMLHGCV